MSFDAYHKWLGIPPEQQPPHYYQLLGISVRETDREVIETAAQRQRSTIEENLHGPHRKAANQLLYEIDEAELTLLTPELREEYDQQVKRVSRKQKRKQSGHNLDPDSNQPVGEGSGLLGRYLAITSVILVGFLIMAWFASQKPRTAEEKKALRAQPINATHQPQPPDKPAVKADSKTTSPEPASIATTKAEAFQWIFSVGGGVRFDSKSPQRVRQRADLPPENTKLFEVDLNSCDIEDQDLQNLIPLAEMESIIVNHTPLTDACIPYLNQLTNLRLLHISGCKITEAGLSELSSQLDLYAYYAGNMNLHDDAAKDFTRYPELKFFAVSGNPITGKSLEDFLALNELLTLHIHQTEIDDESLALLSQFPNLTSLWLGSSLNSEQGLMNSIRNLTQLRALHIYSVPVSDLGTNTLADMKNLKDIALVGTNISDANLARLKQALPDAKISVQK